MVLVFFFLLLLQSCIANKHLYIVHLGGKIREESPDITHKRNYEKLSNLLGSEELAENSLIYSYKHGFQGFAAKLSVEQAHEIANCNGVRVVRNSLLKLHTTRSWDFLERRGWHEHVANESNAAQDIIIGILDSGIWPESRSFHDRGIGPIPKRWKGSCNGTLENCNRKVIGARFYYKGFEEDYMPLSSAGATYFLSARDEAGHGTHVASIAAGRHVKLNNRQVARGGAPHARIAVYKVCWIIGACSSADVLAAFDDAIADGVDIISTSLGFTYSEVEGFFKDGLAIGSFHAMQHGILVSASAGNSGPDMSSLQNIAPWILTVGATSIDREFVSNIVLKRHAKDLHIKGRGLNLATDSAGWHGLAILSRNNGSSISECDDESALHRNLKRKIVVCLNVNASSSAIKNMEHFGIAGMIVIDDIEKAMVTHHSLPVTQVGSKEGTIIQHYIQTIRYPNPSARILHTRTRYNVKPAPIVAAFSSRGPSTIGDILKPDVSAPGENILAAWSRISSFERYGILEVEEGYSIISGTSMSCPHVTAVAANLKAKYPTWSPAAIKSAIVTSASVLDNQGKPIKNYDLKRVANALDMGAGNLNPRASLEPGLVYDTQYEEYSEFMCQLGAAYDFSGKKCRNHKHYNMYNMNYPSISVSNFTTSAMVTRRVTNVGCKRECVFKVSIEAPSGVRVKVVPNLLQFSKLYQTRMFTVEFKVTNGFTQKGHKFGSITWTSHGYRVRSQFVLDYINHV